MQFGLLNLVATVIDFCAEAGERRVGRPPTRTVRVVATLRRFLREGTPWRSLTADAGLACRATLRRRLRTWACGGRLQKAHAVLVRLLRGGPDLIVDSCSVRAKRGGDLTGPNPTDRAKRGTKYYLAVDVDGLPVACVASAANVIDTVLFERLFLAAFAVLARVRTVFADRATTPSGTVRSAAASGRSPASTGAANRTDRVSALGGGRSSAAWLGCWKTGAWRSATTASATSSSPCCRALAYSSPRGA
jgi:hypothetical protein